MTAVSGGGLVLPSSTFLPFFRLRSPLYPLPSPTFHLPPSSSILASSLLFLPPPSPHVCVALVDFLAAIVTMEEDSVIERKWPTLNLLFTCFICGKTLDDVYQTRDTAQHFTDGINPRERDVSKLFLTSCFHVVCACHLPNGGKSFDFLTPFFMKPMYGGRYAKPILLGPTFHPDGDRPRAQCPYCYKNGAQGEGQKFYAVRGFNIGQYDPQIPACFFEVPLKSSDTVEKQNALKVPIRCFCTQLFDMMTERA